MFPGTGHWLRSAISRMKALIVYHTKTGHTRRAAEDIAQGMRDEGAIPLIVAANDMKEWSVEDVAIVAVGSPCHAGSLGIGGGVSGPVRSVLNLLAPTALAGKVAGAFSVNCSYGGHRTVRAIERSLRAAGAHVAAGGIVVRAGVPFSLITGPMASGESRAGLHEFGRALVRATNA